MWMYQGGQLLGPYLAVDGQVPLGSDRQKQDGVSLSQAPNDTRLRFHRPREAGVQSGHADVDVNQPVRGQVAQ